MKKPRPKKGKSQLDKFAEAARRVGADESEDAFKRALKKIAPKPKGKDAKELDRAGCALTR
jgi:hypothetical protein